MVVSVKKINVKFDVTVYINHNTVLRDRKFLELCQQCEVSSRFQVRRGKTLADNKLVDKVSRGTLA